MAVGLDAVGGAEQMTHVLDAALVSAGKRSVVIAAEGSDVHGALLPVPPIMGSIDAIATVQARTHLRLLVRRAIDTYNPHLIHLHGAEYAAVVPEGLPVIASVHRSPKAYAPEIFADHPRIVFQCVAEEQMDDLPNGVRVLPPLGRGVAVPERSPAHARRRFALVLGRISPGKGVHLAIEAAKLADRPLLIAGAPSRRSEDREYFEAEVLPRLDGQRRYLGIIPADRKRRLLAAAHCLLLPNLTDGYSGLAAREALAAGTPVVGFSTGALPSIITHGYTGFLVSDVREMAAAMDVIDVLEREDCRALARKRFPLDLMVKRVFQSYAGLIGGDAASAAVA